jgi:thiamine-phosphate pyrophosphorylase
MMSPRLPRGLYVITDPDCCAVVGLEISVSAAISGGARIVQYRAKNSSAEQRLREARALRLLTLRHDVTCIVNDDPELAAAIDADGVHLGRDDADPCTAHTILGADAIVGISCYDSLERARDAQSAGCDYVAFGSAFPSTTKPDACRAPLDLFARASRELEIPIVAIGGITPTNGSALLAAGCHALAVITGVFGSADICGAAAAYSRLFDPESLQDRLE